MRCRAAKASDLQNGVERLHDIPATVMPKADWSRAFHEPIVVGKHTFETLRDCGTYITKLKTREADAPKWQLAMRVLIEAAEGRGFMDFARVAMLKALLPPPPPIEHTGSSTGSGRWGKRKLKRDL